MTTDPLDCPWRIGRKLGRTIYAVVEGEESRDHDVLLGMMDDKVTAAHIVEIYNADLARRRGALS